MDALPLIPVLPTQMLPETPLRPTRLMMLVPVPRMSALSSAKAGSRPKLELPMTAHSAPPALAKRSMRMAGRLMRMAGRLMRMAGRLMRTLQAPVPRAQAPA